jgi:hypothetical protein
MVGVNGAAARLLCSKHHRLVHEGGFTVRRAFDGEWRFRTAEGRIVSASVDVAQLRGLPKKITYPSKS